MAGQKPFRLTPLTSRPTGLLAVWQKKEDVPRHIGRTKGGLNSKLHAVVNENGKPIIMALTAGQVSDHIGAKLVYPALPSAKTLIGDKGYDSDEFRQALKAKEIMPCIPPRKGRNSPAEYNKTLYKQRYKVGSGLINLDNR